MNLTLIIILAFLLDYCLGEPNKHHPLVFFGSKANAIETVLHKQNHLAYTQKIFGVIALIIMVIPSTTLIYLLSQWNWLYNIISPVILYFCIAAKSLNQHSDNVFQALEKNDLETARQKLA